MTAPMSFTTAFAASLWTACLRVLTFRADRTAKYVGHDAHVHRTLEHAERLLVAASGATIWGEALPYSKDHLSETERAA